MTCECTEQGKKEGGAGARIIVFLALLESRMCDCR